MHELRPAWVHSRAVWLLPERLPRAIAIPSANHRINSLLRQSRTDLGVPTTHILKICFGPEDCEISTAQRRLVTAVTRADHLCSSVFSGFYFFFVGRVGKRVETRGGWLKFGGSLPVYAPSNSPGLLQDTHLIPNPLENSGVCSEAAKSYLQTERVSVRQRRA